MEWVTWWSSVKAGHDTEIKELLEIYEDSYKLPSEARKGEASQGS